MELATGFDLFSRGQWDDFRVWSFAGSDVCFVRLVYLMVRAPSASTEKGTTCLSALFFRALFCAVPPPVVAQI